MRGASLGLVAFTSRLKQKEFFIYDRLQSVLCAEIIFPASVEFLETTRNQNTNLVCLSEFIQTSSD
jgi:hypothetical protein